MLDFSNFLDDFEFCSNLLPVGPVGSSTAWTSGSDYLSPGWRLWLLMLFRGSCGLLRECSRCRGFGARFRSIPLLVCYVLGTLIGAPPSLYQLRTSETMATRQAEHPLRHLRLQPAQFRCYPAWRQSSVARPSDRLAPCSRHSSYPWLAVVLLVAIVDLCSNSPRNPSSAYNFAKAIFYQASDSSSSQDFETITKICYAYRCLRARPASSDEISWAIQENTVDHHLAKIDWTSPYLPARSSSENSSYFLPVIEFRNQGIRPWWTYVLHFHHSQPCRPNSPCKCCAHRLWEYVVLLLHQRIFGGMMDIPFGFLLQFKI